MNFDLDDPLGDLLSDDDSFFESSTKGKNKTKNEKSSATGTKSKMANLFGLDSDKVAEKESPKNLRQNQSHSVASTALNNATDFQRVTTTQKTPAVVKHAVDKDTNERPAAKNPDLFDDLFSNTIPSETNKPNINVKKMNILDDLLHFGTKKTVPTTESRNEAAPSQKNIKPLAKQSESNASSSHYSPSLRRPKSMTRVNSNSSANDPLGFFSSASTTANEITKAPEEKTPKKLAVDWLGLSTAGNEPVNDPIEQKATKVENEKTTVSNTNLVNTPAVVPAPTKTSGILSLQPETFNVDQSAKLFTKLSDENQALLQTLEQQQTQLSIATQMKQQENVLMDMHSKQQVLLKQQEIQFNDLIRRQLSRQTILEENIRKQQELINGQINALLMQPMLENNLIVTDAPGNSHFIRSSESSEVVRNTQIELEAEVRKLELEKLRLEDLMENVREKHKQELDLFETSHKKQISLLEENLVNVENRLKFENKSLEDYYLKQITILNKENEELTSKYEDRTAQLSADYDKNLKKSRADYDTEVENIKNDHRIMIENIRASKLMEFSVVQENGSYLSTLKNASKNLENASGDMQSLKQELESNIERLLNEREAQLSIREKRLEEQKRMMDKFTEAAETERTRLLELVKTLEIKLNCLEQTSAEEQWTLKRQIASTEAERAALEKEKQFYRERQAIEEKRIQNLKNEQLMEFKRLMEQIEAEKSSLMNERIKFETLAKIQPISSSQSIDRNEIETVIKVAQDAAKAAENEREKYVECQRFQEAKKRELNDQKISIDKKQRELESSFSDAQHQKRQAEHAAQSYHMLEKRMLNKLQELQGSFNELAEREAKLSQEKLDISKQRLELNELWKKIFKNRCSLCKIDARTTEISEKLFRKNNNDSLDSVPTNNYLDFINNKLYEKNILNDVDDILNLDKRVNLESIIAAGNVV